MTARRPPRSLHPAAWWAWAIALAVAASRTTNPLLLLLVLAVVGYVVAARRQPSPWSRAFGMFLRLAVAVIVIRVVLFALLAPASGAHVLVRLPQLPLPHWLAGLRLGGPIALEGLLSAAYDGLRLAVVLVCVGAANSLTTPRRMLKSLPAALYEAGVALTVAVAFVPQSVAAVRRVRDARRLRGRSNRGIGAVRGIALPVLQEALDHSIDLAAAMDARGFGRRGTVPVRVRRATAALSLVGFALMLASSYALLASSAPRVLGLPLLIAGVVTTGAGFVVGRGAGGRTRYRPDPWRLTETLVAGCGVATAVTFAIGAVDGAGSSVDPMHWPALPVAAVVGLVSAVLPAWFTPSLPRPRSAATRGSAPLGARTQAAT